MQGAQFTLAPPPVPLIWVVRFVLFKLMVMSGTVKLQAQCPTWTELTALDYHFATQCLPTPVAWYTPSPSALHCHPHLFFRSVVRRAISDHDLDDDARIALEVKGDRQGALRVVSYACTRFESCLGFRKKISSNVSGVSIRRWAHHLPPVMLRWGVAFTLWVEGPAAWLLLSPLRGPRIVGAAVQIALQAMIVATGNYNFFNLLTATLAVLHLDDAALQWGAIHTDAADAADAAEAERLARLARRKSLCHDDKPADVRTRKAAEAAAAAERGSAFEQEASVAARRAARRRGAAGLWVASAAIVAASVGVLPLMLQVHAGLKPHLIIGGAPPPSSHSLF